MEPREVTIQRQIDELQAELDEIRKRPKIGDRVCVSGVIGGITSGGSYAVVLEVQETPTVYAHSWHLTKAD